MEELNVTINSNRNPDMGGSLSDEGCHVTEGGPNGTVCKCDHMTAFTSMAVYDKVSILTISIITTLQPRQKYKLHIWRTWLFITCSDERWLCCQFSLPHLYISRVVNFKFPLQPRQKYKLHIWRTWLFITCSDERWLCCQFSLPHLYVSL